MASCIPSLTNRRFHTNIYRPTHSIMLLFLASALCFEGAYTRISVTEFLDHVWNISSNGAHNVAAGEYFQDAPNNTCYVVREKGEAIITHNYTYYYVYGTKKEIALLTKQLEPLVDNETTIEEMHRDGCDISFVILKAEASEYQQSVFWINIVVWAIILAGVLTGLLLWHCDNYAKDPGNSLLFVTDGNRIVTGQ